jgi:hypothetical protein
LHIARKDQATLDDTGVRFRGGNLVGPAKDDALRKMILWGDEYAAYQKGKNFEGSGNGTHDVVYPIGADKNRGNSLGPTGNEAMRETIP